MSAGALNDRRGQIEARGKDVRACLNVRRERAAVADETRGRRREDARGSFVPHGDIWAAERNEPELLFPGTSHHGTFNAPQWPRTRLSASSLGSSLGAATAGGAPLPSYDESVGRGVMGCRIEREECDASGEEPENSAGQRGHRQARLFGRTRMSVCSPLIRASTSDGGCTCKHSVLLLRGGFTTTTNFAGRNTTTGALLRRRLYAEQSATPYSRNMDVWPSRVREVGQPHSSFAHTMKVRNLPRSPTAGCSRARIVLYACIDLAKAAIQKKSCNDPLDTLQIARSKWCCTVAQTISEPMSACSSGRGDRLELCCTLSVF